ncbi:MAG: GDP-mannose 4,6-dehydratase [Anaerolineales bacterium]|nr:GDP-mannose 4,6-dehydratase [Anaerolineales bacterium]
MSKILVTGGTGFIGSNLANQLIKVGHDLTIMDNLSRPGSEKNLEWLKTVHPDRFNFFQADIRDWNAVQTAAAGAERIYHLASQVAVTTSVLNPREDFEINAGGALNLLEAARTVADDPIFIYASTNKVYGAMDDIDIVEAETRYSYRDHPAGISESYPLDFHSPYGCSKGAGDQYTRDYARIYGLRSIVFRQSCIYGTRQFGIEDQGWVAFFLIAAAMGWPVTIYGDGKQVRDVLMVDDLLRAYEMAIAKIDVTAGQIYNVGGGPAYTLSVWAEFGPLIERLLGRPLPILWGDWRPGDQKVFVADIAKAEKDFGWRPQISPQEGVPILFNWVQENRHLFR